MQVQYSVAIALSEHNLHGLQFYHFRRLAILLGFQFYHFRRLTIQKQETRHLAHPIFQTSIGKTGIAQIANIDLHGLHFATLGVLGYKTKKLGCLTHPVLLTLNRRARNSGVTHDGLHGLQFCHIRSFRLLNRKEWDALRVPFCQPWIDEHVTRGLHTMDSMVYDFATFGA